MNAISEAQRTIASPHMIFDRQHYERVIADLLDPLAGIDNPTPQDVLDAVRTVHLALAGE